MELNWLEAKRQATLNPYFFIHWFGIIRHFFVVHHIVGNTVGLEKGCFALGILTEAMVVITSANLTIWEIVNN